MSYAADPISEFETKLQGQGYTALPDFAVLDECEFFDKRTGQNVSMTPERLSQMAAAQNQRVRGRNDATPIILGHTEDNKDEADQPPIVGYATRFQVGRLPDGKSAVFARPWAAPGQVETFRKHPRRSVELWLDPDAIDPIALLGATTPRRDLGLHLFARQYADPADATSGSVVRFSRNTEPGRQPVLFEMREQPVRLSAFHDAVQHAQNAPHDHGSWHALGDALEEAGHPQAAWARAVGNNPQGYQSGDLARLRQLAAEKPRAPATAPVDEVKPDFVAHGPRMQRGSHMNPVKCDLPPDGAAPAAGDTGPVEAGQDVKALSAKVDKCLAFIDKFSPILEQVMEEEQAAQGPPGGGGPPGAGPDARDAAGAPPEGGFQAGPPSPAGGMPPDMSNPDNAPPDREDGPYKKNAAGAPGLGSYSAPGYGNTSMPKHFAADPETRVRMQRLEDENTRFRAAQAEAGKEIAALRLQRMEDETNALLDALDREGVTLDREHDFKQLVRMSKAERQGEAERMKRLRLRKAPALPGNGGPAVNPADVAGPQMIRFERTDGGFTLPGDPSVKTAIPDDYDALAALIAQGTGPKAILAPTANGTKVR